MSTKKERKVRAPREPMLPNLRSSAELRKSRAWFVDDQGLMYYKQLRTAAYLVNALKRLPQEDGHQLLCLDVCPKPKEKGESKREIPIPLKSSTRRVTACKVEDGPVEYSDVQCLLSSHGLYSPLYRSGWVVLSVSNDLLSTLNKTWDLGKKPFGKPKKVVKSNSSVEKTSDVKSDVESKVSDAKSDTSVKVSDAKSDESMLSDVPKLDNASSMDTSKPDEPKEGDKMDVSN